MGILDDWIEDMPQQFQGKERIEALISAFAKQIEELHRCIFHFSRFLVFRHFSSRQVYVSHFP